LRLLKKRSPDMASRRSSIQRWLGKSEYQG
jgi:hypothetical protein